MSALLPKADIRNWPSQVWRNSSGSLAIFAAIRASGGPVLLGSELAGGRAATHDADFSGAVCVCRRRIASSWATGGDFFTRDGWDRAAPLPSMSDVIDLPQ